MRRLIFVCCALLALAGCQSAYYSAMEKAGIHKRDILVDRVEDARDSQQAAKEQFKDALERYRSVVEVKGGDLEKRYDALNRQYEASVASARMCGPASTRWKTSPMRFSRNGRAN